MVNSKKSSDSEIFLNWPFLYPGLGHRDPPRPGPQGPGAKRLIFFFKSRVLSKRQGLIFKKTYTVWHSLQIVWRRQNSTDNFCIELGKKINLTWKIVNKKSKIAIKPYFLLSIYDGMGWFWIVSTHWSRILPSRTAKVDIFSDFHGFWWFFQKFGLRAPEIAFLSFPVLPKRACPKGVPVEPMSK